MNQIDQTDQMNQDIYDTLLNVIKNNIMNITTIKEQYFELLGQLTDAPIMTNDEFINKVNEISKMGTIIVCYRTKIIATGTIIVEPKLIHGGKSVGHIEDIVVDKDHRKEGIATNIVNKLLDLSDCYKVILDCKDDLVDFYKLAGFKKYGNQMAKYL